VVLPRLYDALKELENFHEAGDGRQVSIRCPYCGDSNSDFQPHSLSIKIDVEPGEPMLFQCFRASCGTKGRINTTTLKELGITDPDVIAEVVAWNKTVKGGYEKPFITRSTRGYALVNLPVLSNVPKLQYVNDRLGTNFNYNDLKDLKIQLSLAEMLRVNEIRRLSVKPAFAQMLDNYCIAFISMFSDYAICRDITPNNKLKMRYYSYRISGKPDPNDLKIYTIPGEIDIMDPHSAIINVAEGPFSILGAYLNTDLGREKPNSIWVANCGAEYTNSILRVCKQYGLLKVRINIWSDSEITIDAYEKLYKKLKDRLDIRRMTIYYNDAEDDFGHAKKDIQIHKATIYEKHG